MLLSGAPGCGEVCGGLEFFKICFAWMLSIPWECQFWSLVISLLKNCFQDAKVPFQLTWRLEGLCLEACVHARGKSLICSRVLLYAGSWSLKGWSEDAIVLLRESLEWAMLLERLKVRDGVVLCIFSLLLVVRQRGWWIHKLCAS